jgi:uncharacterized phage protein (TIGR02220 family)
VKRPSFQFYHGDWRSNAKLRRCTDAQRGIWLEVMCLMADEDEFGVLRWPLKDVSNAVPCRIAELRILAERGVLKGADVGETCQAVVYTPRHAGRDGTTVVLIPEQPGPIWYSSRMVRDAYIASIRGKGTRFGDGPKSAPTQRIGDGPSSSTSSSPSVKEKEEEEPIVGLKPDAAPVAKNGHDHEKLKVLKAQAREVLLFLNEKAGKNYEPVDANLDLIAARLKEGAKVEDMRAVIAKRCREWLTNPEMNRFLQPATLFGKKNWWQKYQGELAPEVPQ